MNSRHETVRLVLGVHKQHTVGSILAIDDIVFEINNKRFASRIAGNRVDRLFIGRVGAEIALVDLRRRSSVVLQRTYYLTLAGHGYFQTGGERRIV